MSYVIAVSNQKGGVGKTTVTVNLGKNLFEKGFKVLLIDCDPQGDLAMSVFGKDIPESIVSRGASKSTLPGLSNTCHLFSEDAQIEPLAISETLHLIGASQHLSEISTKDIDIIFEFRDNVDALRSQYDYILIDCLPSFGLLQTAAHMTADYIVIPTHLDSFSVSGIEKQLKTVYNTKRRLNSKLELLGIIINEASGQRVNVESYFLEQLQQEYGHYLFNTQITKSVKVKESNALLQSVHEYSQSSEQAKQYQMLTTECLERIEKKSVVEVEHAK